MQPMRCEKARREHAHMHTGLKDRPQGQPACTKRVRPRCGRQLSAQGLSVNLRGQIYLPRVPPPNREQQVRTKVEEGDLHQSLAVTASAQESCI